MESIFVAKMSKAHPKQTKLPPPRVLDMALDKFILSPFDPAREGYIH